MFKRLPEPKTLIDDLYFETLSSRREDIQGELDVLTKLFSGFFSNENYSVLDIGAGHGDYSILLAENFDNWNITAIDNDKKALEWSKSLQSNYNKNNIKFKLSDIFKLDEKVKFDRINMRYSLHHIDDIGKLFEKTYSIQEKNARLFIYDFNPQMLNSQSIYRSARQLRTILPDKLFMKAFIALGYEDFLTTAVSYHAAYKATNIIDAMKKKYKLVNYFSPEKIYSHAIEVIRL